MKGAPANVRRGGRVRRPVMSEVAPAASPRRRIVLPIRHDWRFLLGDVRGRGHELWTEAQRWQAVNLPHSARLEPLNSSGGRNYQGVCWYCRNLPAPGEWRDRLVQLHFDGAMHAAEVWINGRKAGENFCGYLPFIVDATPLLRFGGAENIVAIRLDNSDDPRIPPGKPLRELDFTYFAGLSRHASVHVVDRLRITEALEIDRTGGGGVLVTYPKVTQAEAIVHARIHVRNDRAGAASCTLQSELIDPSGATVATTSAPAHIEAGEEFVFDQKMELPRPALWHPDHPNLYQLRTTLSDASGPIDERIERIGIRHIRFDPEGGLLINHEPFFSIGANRHQDHPFVGYGLPDSAHFRDARKLRDGGFTSFRSHYPQAPAFMDACDELGILAIVSNPGWQFVGDELFRRRALANARNMVRRDRNRPSVILWEAALNESDNGALGVALQRAVHEEYPGDQCFTAGDREAGWPTWDVEYLHNDGGMPYWIREWGDHVDNWSDQQSRSRVPRRWGETAMLTQAHSHLARMDELYRQRPRLCGACLWAGIDYQRGYHRDPFFGGVLDLFRLPKFSYYLFQSQRPTSADPMVFIASFATFFSPRNVTVFSNCDEVRLFLDGKEISRRKPDAGHALPHPPFTFEVAAFAAERSTMYMTGVAAVEPPAGVLRAEGLIDGKVAATHIVRPPGVASQIRLEADVCGRELLADGSDWIRIHAHICDRRGTVNPFCDDSIEFSAAGAGRLIGDGTIGANPARAEAGVATALVQSTAGAGKIVVTARSPGLAEGRIEIQSLPVQ